MKNDYKNFLITLILDIEAGVGRACRFLLIEIIAREASPLDGQTAINAFRVGPASGAVVVHYLGGALPVHYGASPILAELGRVVIELVIAAQE